MTAMKKKDQERPRSPEELAGLAAYYDSHDTSAEMEHGQWVEPQPMKTTFLRLPADVVEALKKLAQARGVRYTALLREVVEQVARPLIVILSGVAVLVAGLVWSALAHTPGTGVHFGAAVLITVGELAILIGIVMGIRAFITSRRSRRKGTDAPA